VVLFSVVFEGFFLVAAAVVAIKVEVADFVELAIITLLTFIIGRAFSL
jgi:hypothetical protein